MGTSGGPSTLSTLSPSARETVDPIAELLSQLSGVRRAAGSSSSQLHQLQMELELQRQQAQAQRQTLDRLARRSVTSSSAPVFPASATASQSAATVTVAASGAQQSSSQAVGSTTAKTQNGSADNGNSSTSNNSSSGFLLADLGPEDEEEAWMKGERGEGGAKQNMFLADVLLGALSIQSDSEPES